MELALVCIRYPRYLIKAIAIIQTKQTKNRQKYSCSKSHGAPDIKRIKLIETIPNVTAFCKRQHKYCCRLACNNRVTQFERVLIVYCASRVVIHIIIGTDRNNGEVLVTAKPYDIATL